LKEILLEVPPVVASVIYIPLELLGKYTNSNPLCKKIVITKYMQAFSLEILFHLESVNRL